MNSIDFKTLILQAEIAALLHDIGKFTRHFLEQFLKNGNGGQYDHAWDFLKEDSNACSRNLLDVLNQSLDDAWLKVPGEIIHLKTLGDLSRLHHEKNLDRIKTHLDAHDVPNLPLLLALMMIADSIDSSSSKGGAAFRLSKNVERKSLLNQEPFSQDLKKAYLATPLGEKQTEIRLEQTKDAAQEFQDKVAGHLSGYASWNIEELIDARDGLLTILEKQLAEALAETRKPTNDVSLWQHSRSTASIFKAMLARHLLLGIPAADEHTNLLHHRERLAFLGIRWSEDALLARSVRPPDILGRRMRLARLTGRLKEKVETGFCLGNEVYRDRDGICFLIPSPQEDERIRTALNEMLDFLELDLNDGRFFGGELEYRIVCKEVGIQVLGLSSLLEETEEVDVLRSGPRSPRWMDLWDKANAREVCPRCGKRPIPLVPFRAGSEGSDSKKDNTCEFCWQINKEAEKLRSNSREVLYQPSAEFQTVLTDKLVPIDVENQRLALVQGFFDLRAFLSGEAFSDIMARRPEDYDQAPERDPKSKSLITWSDALTAAGFCLQELKGDNAPEEVVHTLQQLYQDTYLGQPGDGRVPGTTSPEKIRNYIDQIVLASPFPEGLTDPARLLLYAFRQHPSPSRITRVRETTERILHDILGWFEQAKVFFFPLSLDPGRFLVLLRADLCQDFLFHAYDRYLAHGGRVRHLLPFHLSASIFRNKAPLYIGIDAMRRFADLQHQASTPRKWLLENKSDTPDEKGAYRLEWRDHLGRRVIWEMPVERPEGGEERFYSWFRVSGEERLYSVKDLQPGQEVLVRPSTFDYEVLDTTTRRYDIRSGRGNLSGRPHLFCGEGGPRPYPLSHLEQWRKVLTEDSPFTNLEKHQISRLMGLLGDLHLSWPGCTQKVFQTQTRDILKITIDRVMKKMPESRTFLEEAAVSGEIFDLLEWKHFIGKKSRQKETIQ